MLIWAWIFAVPFIVAAIDLARTGRSSSGNVRYADRRAAAVAVTGA